MDTRFNPLPLLAAAILLGACHANGGHTPETYGVLRQVDSLLDNGCGPYEVASFLYSHPEQLDLPVDSLAESHCVRTSADGRFRVYSIADWRSGSTCDIHNLFLYWNGDDDIHLKADAGDLGCIKDIGMFRSGDKTYYILVSEYVAVHQGMCITTTVSIYSLDRSRYDSLKRESLFLTKDYRLIDSIEVQWDDDGTDEERGYPFGIALDDREDTREVYVQVIDGRTGEATGLAIVYRRDGRRFGDRGLTCVDSQGRARPVVNPSDD